MKNPRKQVFSLGQRVCFLVSYSKTNEKRWHIGEIALLLPVKKPGDPEYVHIVPYEIPDALPMREGESEGADDPVYFRVPEEAIILDRLSSRALWNPKRLPPVVVDARDVCVARHYEFFEVFCPKKDLRQHASAARYR